MSAPQKAHRKKLHIAAHRGTQRTLLDMMVVKTCDSAARAVAAAAERAKSAANPRAAAITSKSNTIEVTKVLTTGRNLTDNSFQHAVVEARLCESTESSCVVAAVSRKRARQLSPTRRAAHEKHTLQRSLQNSTLFDTANPIIRAKKVPRECEKSDEAEKSGARGADAAGGVQSARAAVAPPPPTRTAARTNSSHQRKQNTLSRSSIQRNTHLKPLNGLQRSIPSSKRARQMLDAARKNVAEEYKPEISNEIVRLAAHNLYLTRALTLHRASNGERLPQSMVDVQLMQSAPPSPEATLQAVQQAVAKKERISDYGNVAVDGVTSTATAAAAAAGAARAPLAHATASRLNIEKRRRCEDATSSSNSEYSKFSSNAGGERHCLSRSVTAAATATQQQQPSRRQMTATRHALSMKERRRVEQYLRVNFAQIKAHIDAEHFG